MQIRKCTIVIEGLEGNGTNEMASCFYLFCGTRVKSAQAGKQAHSDLPKEAYENMTHAKLILINHEIIE